MDQVRLSERKDCGSFTDMALGVQNLAFSRRSLSGHSTAVGADDFDGSLFVRSDLGSGSPLEEEAGVALPAQSSGSFKRIVSILIIGSAIGFLFGSIGIISLAAIL